MLAGVFELRGRRNRAAIERRLVHAFGPGAAELAGFAGPLAVISERPAGFADTGGANEVGIALDGSIYNSLELAGELDADPRAGDTELLARAYERWGERMLEKLRGGFALVAWREDGGRVLLAQDQVAIGALFVHRDANELAFASEVHHLLALLPRTPEPDSVAVVRSLALESLHDGRTMFKGVRRLGAGRALVIADGRASERRYYSPSYVEPMRGSRLESAAMLRDAVIGAVGLRMRGIGAVGVTLSGGFDSSAIAAAAARGRDADQRLYGYSAVFPDDPRMDDRDHLDVLAEKLPIANVRLRVAPGGALRVALDYLREWRLPLI
ncbi:MAG: asparagine synthase-related protein, partial [Solirubrobacteraceae bacterium]